MSKQNSEQQIPQTYFDLFWENMKPGLQERLQKSGVTEDRALTFLMELCESTARMSWVNCLETHTGVLDTIAKAERKKAEMVAEEARTEKAE